MADSGDQHTTLGRRHREKGPPSVISTAQGALPRLERVSDIESEHSDDFAGEKETKRQRSKPIIPLSTSSRLPCEYDALRGIARVGTKEGEGFEEDLDSTEHHDAIEEPIRKDVINDPNFFSDYLGSKRVTVTHYRKGASVDLLNVTSSHVFVPFDSGVGQNSTDLSQKCVGPLIFGVRLGGPVWGVEKLPKKKNMSNKFIAWCMHIEMP